MRLSKERGHETLFYCVVGGILYLLFYVFYQSMTSIDPDRYFHLAIARSASKQLVVRIPPQAEDLGWSDNYNNPYFLFSVITGIFYRFLGETFTLYLVPPLLGLLLFFSFFLFAKRYLPPRLVVIVFLLAILTPYFGNRFVAFRPHMLAIPLFFLGCVGIVERRSFLVFISGALYALSYHGLFIPLIPLAVALVLGLTSDVLKTILFGTAGTLCGILVSPYFPDNLFQVREFLQAGLNQVQVPLYLLPIESRTLEWSLIWQQFPFYLLVFLFALALLFPLRTRRLFPMCPIPSSESTRKILFALILAGGFWIGMFLNTRSIEYAIPSTLLLIVFCLDNLKKIRGFNVCFGIAVALFFVPNSVAFLHTNPPEFGYLPAPVFDAVESIPAESKGKKVFNCEWDMSPYLFFARPELRFVDIGDPRPLMRKSPRLFALRTELQAGKAAYPYGVIRYAFGSDYVFCRNSVIINQLMDDPYFRRIFPPPQTRVAENTPVLFELRPTPLPNFVKKYDISFQSQLTRKRFVPGPLPEGVSWSPVRFAGLLNEIQRSPFLDIHRWLNDNTSNYMTAGSKAGLLCAFVRPSALELKQHSGAEWLGLGNTALAQLWWNHKPFFISDLPEPSFRLVNHLVPLPHPLTVSDDITALVCSPKSTLTFGVAFSFWNDHDLEETCRWKGKESFGPKHIKGWELTGQVPKACLSWLAVKPYH